MTKYGGEMRNLRSIFGRTSWSFILDGFEINVESG